MTICPCCEKGELKIKSVREEVSGVFLGDFSAEVCTSCRESFTNRETTRKIEEAAKREGIFGLGRNTKTVIESHLP